MSNPENVNVKYIPRPEKVTPEYMLAILNEYYERKWNTNAEVLKTLKKWIDWPLMLRMPDIQTDFTVFINGGKVEWVKIEVPKEPKLLAVLLSDTQQRVYYDETTMAIESIAGRIKIRGNEAEKRRMLAALSYLTW